jgi:hypothetical protein
MTYSPAIGAPIDQPTRGAPKLRQCLKCRATFHSEWAGERVCSHCKSLNAWRNGVRLRSCPSIGRR